MPNTIIEPLAIIAMSLTIGIFLLKSSPKNFMISHRYGKIPAVKFVFSESDDYMGYVRAMSHYRAVIAANVFCILIFTFIFTLPISQQIPLMAEWLIFRVVASFNIVSFISYIARMLIVVFRDSDPQNFYPNSKQATGSTRPA